MPITDALAALPGYDDRARLIQTYRDYYDGRHQLRYATPDFERKYGDVVRSMRENLIPSVLSAYADKSMIESWGTSNDDLDSADREGLDRLHARVTREKFLTGSAFALVWPGTDKTPTPHFHRADQIIPVVDPLRPSQLKYAVKPIIDSDRLPRLNIYYPDRVERYARITPLARGTNATWGEWDNPDEWFLYDADNEESVIRHDFAAVPVCWWKHDDDGPTSWGRSVISDAIPLQDGLNASVAALVVLGEAYARPFWYLLNYSSDGGGGFAPDDAFAKALRSAQDQVNTAAASTQFDPKRQQIFTTDSPGPFGQLDPPDLTRLVEVQDAFAAKIARVTGVPSFYLGLSTADAVSGESLRRRQVRLDTAIRTSNRESLPVWRGLKSLLGMDDIAPTYADPNPVTRAERIDEALKMKELGYPLEELLKHVEEATDVDELLQAVKAERAQDAAAIGRALASGRPSAGYPTV